MSLNSKSCILEPDQYGFSERMPCHSARFEDVSLGRQESVVERLYVVRQRA